MFKLSSYILRLGPLPGPLSALRRCSSPSAQAAPPLPKGPPGEQVTEEVHKSKRPKSLVEAAFLNLNSPDDSNTSVGNKKFNFIGNRKAIDEKIDKATNTSALLSIVDTDMLSKVQALKIVSILSQWSKEKRVNMGDFENDPRFYILCRILGRQINYQGTFTASMAAKKSEDLNTVISIAGDDEAARLVPILSNKQMIKVMTTLALKKRRSPALLRTLSYHITKSSEVLNLKTCGDLLFAMATLSFPDPLLLDRISSDIQEYLPQNTDKSSVLGSIATSLGILKCKDKEVLDAFTDWMVEHSSVTRIQDVANLIITLAVVGYSATNVDKLTKLTWLDFSKSSTYLDYVWSLVVLNIATKEQISSVLDLKFLENLKGEQDIPLFLVKKLLNINSYAMLVMKDYKGPFLDDSVSKDISLSYSKEKTLFIGNLLDTLKSLLTSSANLKTYCNTKMGFLYDAECLLDSKCNPYPVDTNSTVGKVLTKVAMLGLEYHDICRQTNDPLGFINLYKRLLEAQGYKVMMVPYTEYNAKDKLVNRVQYIERRLKDIVQSDTSKST